MQLRKSCLICFTQRLTKNTVYNAATQVTPIFTISKASQTLTIDTISTKNVGDADFVPDVLNTAGLPVTIGTTTASVCTAANNAVTIIATGTCTITANASATATHNAAGQKTLSFTVSSARAVRIYYVHTDQIDTPRQITAASNNTVMWRWDNQDAFGDNTPNEKPSGSGQAFKYHLRFAGQLYDQETDTSYNYFRDYDANLGRYAQSDPIGLAGGINTYAYVGGNPLLFTDPLGLLGQGSGGNGKVRRNAVGAGANASVGAGASGHTPFGFGIGIDGGVSADTAGNLCFYSNICYTVGPGMSASIGAVGSIGSGRLTSGTTDYTGACWSGGSGLGGSGSLLFGKDGSAQTGRGLFGPSVGGSATYQSCRVQTICVKN